MLKVGFPHIATDLQINKIKGKIKVRRGSGPHGIRGNFLALKYYDNGRRFWSARNIPEAKNQKSYFC